MAFVLVTTVKISNLTSFGLLLMMMMMMIMMPFEKKYCLSTDFSMRNVLDVTEKFLNIVFVIGDS
jgi:hypothetical protein